MDESGFSRCTSAIVTCFLLLDTVSTLFLTILCLCDVAYNFCYVDCLCCSFSLEFLNSWPGTDFSISYLISCAVYLS